MNVAFKPTRSDAVSVARLQFTSNSDDATDKVLLAAKSSASFSQSVGGTVGTVLGLTIPSAASFGAFVPAVTATYNTSMAATVTHTVASANLTVTDPSPTATGRLVNGAYALPSPLQVRATNVANPSTAYAPLSATPSSPLTLLSYAGPVSGDAVTIGLRQSIAATDALLAGAYSKTLTFELANTTP